jgi:anti-sigma factor RsiW
VDDWEELAVDYVDGSLDSGLKAAVEGHLSGCPACAARLQKQMEAVPFLRQTALDDPPADLEDRVLGEIVFPSVPARSVRAQAEAEASPWSLVWRRKIRPWVPAMVAVVAVLAAAVSFGVLHGGTESADMAEGTTTVAAAQAKIAEGAADESAANTETTSAAAATMLGAAPGVTTTAVSDSTTVAMYASRDDMTLIQDAGAMAEALATAGGPVYFVFEQGVDGDSALSAEQAQAIATQLTALTGLQPLEDTLSAGGPTFVAYVPRDDAQRLVDLLRSIGSSLQLTVGLVVERPSTVADWETQLADRKARIAELSTSHAPRSAASSKSFTTSTLESATGGAGAEEPLADSVGTHVLVVILTNLGG